MMKIIMLISVAILAQICESTMTVSKTKDHVLYPYCEENDCGTVPSAKEIQLIRESWPAVKKNKDVFSEFVLEHYRVHPKTQELLPQLANIALADMPANDYFVKLTQTYIPMGMQEMVDNLDNSAVLSVLLECLHPEWYVDYVSVDRQNRETLRIFFKVLEENMGDQLSESTKAAWTKGMTYATSFMKMRPSHTNENSVLSANDVALVRKFHAASRDNLAIATTALIKMFTLHPESQKLVPALAGVPVDQLMGNQDFLVLAHTCSAVADFIVSNLDNEKVLTHILVQQTKPEQFVDYMHPIHQLDETATLVMAAIDEVVSPDAATKQALANVMKYVNDIMATKLVPNNEVQSVAEPVVSAKEKALIRDSWNQMRFNSEVAPKIYLKMFAAHPEVQSLFPQFANVPATQLSQNKNFLALSYGTFYGMTFIINNMDNPQLLHKQISKMASPVFYVASPTIAQQNDETIRIVLEVFREELGSTFTAESASAWTSLLSYVNSVLEENLSINPITTDEKSILSDNLVMVKQNKKFGGNMLIKMFLSHPKTRDLFPNFAKVPISSLPNNAEFVAISNMMLSGFEFMVQNIDQPQVLRQVLGNKPIGQYFVADIPIELQLEETSRMVIDAFDEELGARFTPITRKAWKRAFLLVNSIMAESL